MSRSVRQFRAAQRQFDNAHDDQREADEAREEAIDALLRDASWRAANKARADEWIDGSFDGDHYTALESALADLGELSADAVPGSDALAAVLRLAEVHAKARWKQLREFAEVEVDGSRDAA